MRQSRVLYILDLIPVFVCENVAGARHYVNIDLDFRLPNYRFTVAKYSRVVFRISNI